MNRIPIKLKFWQDGSKLSKIASISEKVFSNFEKPLKMVTKAIDVEKANIELVKIIGWGRGIDPFQGESEKLYRKRVKYALQNSQDAGCVNGFSKIWKRLGLGTLTQKERVDKDEWDVIQLEIDEAVFWEYQFLLDSLIQLYGRTCRRYVLSTVSTSTLEHCITTIDSESNYCEAKFLGNTNCSHEYLAVANFKILKNIHEAKI